MGKRGKSMGKGGGSSSSSHNHHRIEKRIIEKPPSSSSYSSRRGTSTISSSPVAPPPPYISSSRGDQLSPSFHGYIFMCNGKTKSDCYKFRVFGLPAARMDILYNIRPGMKLFLFDFDLRLLYGIYEPASMGQLSIVPSAFAGRFSAQVRFQVYKDCLPLPESVFRPVLKDNYQGSKFRQELTSEHVQNLISLFRPVDMSPSQGFISPKRNDEHPGYGVYSRPGEGQPHHSQHIRHIEEPLLHVSHTSSVRVQPHLRQYSSDEAHQAYLREEELYNRCAAVRDDQSRLINKNSIAEAHHISPSQLSTPSHGRHGHLSTKPFSAAYWISLANESLQKEMHTHPFQGTPSASTGTAAPNQTPPVEEREAPIISHHPPPENNDTSLAAATSLVVQAQAEDGPTHFATSSSVPEYWTPVTFQDPNQVCSDHSQWQQAANTGVNTENAPTYAVQTGANHYFPDTGTTFDNYNHHGTIPGTNGVPVQTHDPTVYYSGTSGVPAQAYDMSAAYCPSQASDLAAYYSGTTTVHPQEHNPTTAYYYVNTGIPTQAHEVAAYYCANTGVPGQAHESAPYYLQENSYGYSNVPSSSQAPTHWDPNQVGVTHFHQQIIPSGNSINSLGGEHLTVSHPGAANTVPANGL